MALPSPPAATATSPDTRSAAGTRLRGRWLALARAALGLVAVASIAAFVADLPNRFGILLRSSLGLEPFLAQLGLPADFLARYFIALDLISLLVFSAIAVLIFSRRSDDWLALFASSVAVTYGAVGTFFLYAFGRLPPGDHLPLTLLQPLGLGGPLVFYYVFPNGRFVPGWTRALAVAFAAWAVAWFLYPPAALNAWPPLLGYAALMAWYGTAVLAQVYRYRRVSGQVERQRTKGIVAGLVVIDVLWSGSILVRLAVPPVSQPGLPQLVFDLVSTPVVVLGQLVLPVSFAVALLRYRLWDINRLTNRTLVYGALTGTLVLVYYGSVALLQGLFRGLTGQGSDLAIIAATLASAALFQPLRRQLQVFIDRRFYRRKYDAARTLAAFSTAVRDDVDLTRLTDRLVAVVEETMQPAHVSLWLRPTGPEGRRSTSSRGV